MKKNIKNLVVLSSVGCLIDQETLDTFPCPKGLSEDAYISYIDGEAHITIKNLEVDTDEAVNFEQTTDEWLEALSSVDLRRILYLMRDNATKYRVNL